MDITLDIGGNLLRCTPEHAQSVCQQLRALGFGPKGLPIVGAGHGPRARFLYLRSRSLEIFAEHFDHHWFSQDRKMVFEQVVVVTAVRMLHCDPHLFVGGYDRAGYVGRLLLQRRQPEGEEAALHQAVSQGRRNGDFAPCLVYADWLEEQGHPYLAERFRNNETEAILGKGERMGERHEARK